MKFFPRLSGFIYALLSLLNIPLLLSLFALPIVLASGRPLIAYASLTQLRWLIITCFATQVSTRLCELVQFLPAGYANGQRGARAQLWMSPYMAVCMIRSFLLPHWLGGAKHTFQPTGSIRSELNERDPVLRAGLIRRLRVVLVNYLAAFHIIYVYFVLSTVTLTTGRCIVEQPNTHAQLQCLLTHAFWPPIAWITVVSAFWVPITYAIEPPSMPPREEMLVRDLKTGVARPKEECKRVGWGRREYLFEGAYALSTAFTIFVFVVAFWWI
jgi:hypothetical protein